ncbi:MAG: ParB/RepB/Spo0J family partition protein [Erysipelothrix sp.]|nr:ParB/RepB/Spo0J family partition protein [Erysipelothrix sp.]
MANNNRLGKGLGAIFGDDVSNILEEIQQGNREDLGHKTQLPINDVRPNPYQPRRYFDEVKLGELAESIRQHGLFTPVLVREAKSGYELVAGERRLRASKIAGLEFIEAIVVEFNDEQMMEIAIIENIQREDLNVLEEAQGYQLLIDNLHLTQEDVAQRVNKSRSHVANLLRLLRLPTSVQKMVQEGKLTMGHVRPLITLENPKEIERYAKEIYAKKLSVRDAERLINQIDNEDKPKIRIKRKDYEYAETLFEKKLQTRILIENKKINISFEDDEDLNRILDVLGLIE